MSSYHRNICLWSEKDNERFISNYPIIDEKFSEDMEYLETLNLIENKISQEFNLFREKYHTEKIMVNIYDLKFMINSLSTKQREQIKQAKKEKKEFDEAQKVFQELAQKNGYDVALLKKKN